MLNPLEPWSFLLAVLCAYRGTRFIVFDSLIGSHLESGTKWSQRLDRWAFTSDGKDKNWFVAKLATLLTCIWCTGFWVSLVTVSVMVWRWPWNFDAYLWVVVWAVAAGQALLSSVAHRWIE